MTEHVSVAAKRIVVGEAADYLEQAAKSGLVTVEITDGDAREALIASNAAWAGYRVAIRALRLLAIDPDAIPDDARELDDPG